jgi:hypothetical protein
VFAALLSYILFLFTFSGGRMAPCQIIPPELYKFHISVSAGGLASLTPKLASRYFVVVGSISSIENVALDKSGCCTSI